MWIAFASCSFMILECPRLISSWTASDSVASPLFKDFWNHFTIVAFWEGILSIASLACVLPDFRRISPADISSGFRAVYADRSQTPDQAIGKGLTKRNASTNLTYPKRNHFPFCGGKMLTCRYINMKDRKPVILLGIKAYDVH